MNNYDRFLLCFGGTGNGSSISTRALVCVYAAPVKRLLLGKNSKLVVSGVLTRDDRYVPRKLVSACWVVRAATELCWDMRTQTTVNLMFPSLPWYLDQDAMDNVMITGIWWIWGDRLCGAVYFKFQLSAFYKFFATRLDPWWVIEIRSLIRRSSMVSTLKEAVDQVDQNPSGRNVVNSGSCRIVRHHCTVPTC